MTDPEALKAEALTKLHDILRRECQATGPRGCAVTGCDHLGEWFPVLVSPFTAGPPGRALLNLPHCREHRDEATVAPMLEGAGWLALEEAARATGHALISREAVRLEWLTVPVTRH